MAGVSRVLSGDVHICEGGPPALRAALDLGTQIGCRTKQRCGYNPRVTLTLREFRQGDFTRLWEIDQECFPPGIAYSRLELLHYIRRVGAFTLVAESDGEIAGFSVAERSRQRGHVITLDVRESFRRAGVASRLMDAVEERFVTLSCGVSLLETAVDNLGAIAFYKRRGYTVLKTIPRYYERNLDALLMGKKLPQPVPEPQQTTETSG